MRPGRMFLERSRVAFDHVLVISSQSHRFERRWRDRFSRGARNSRISDHWAGLERERGLREEYIRIFIYINVCVCVCVCLVSKVIGRRRPIICVAILLRRESLILDERRGRLPANPLLQPAGSVRSSAGYLILLYNTCARQPPQRPPALTAICKLQQ